MNKTVKQVGIVLIAVIFVLSLGNNGCQRRKLIDYTKKITTIENANTQLLTTIKDKDAELIVSDAEILNLKSKNTELEGKNEALRASESSLAASLAIISDEVSNIPADSSYALLQAVYPYEGELKYPFNERQVKEIHINYLEKLTLRDLNDNLKAQVSNLSHQLKFSDAIQRKLVEQVYILKSEKKDYEEIVTNKSAENDLLSKQNKKEKRKVVFYKVTTGVAAGLIILVAL